MMSNPPEAYQVGWVPFINTKIWLDSKPLIPRTETEYWVNEVICKLQALNCKLKVLDLCAGSGCIGVAVAKEVPEAHIDFAEINEAHHSNILKNIRINNIDESRTRIFGGDLFEHIAGKYDIILSNPPYINKALGRVEKGVQEHEPALALYGGQGGLEVIDRILAEAPKHLNPDGVLWLEHEPEQVPHLAARPGYLGSYPDQYGLPRYSKYCLI